uniref:Uncharacterized protein n=1 Tax=Picea sitchensis TaxID=3332 RepID=D5ABP2_PICSI|nr:unknown [Picea sitchensis]
MLICEAVINAGLGALTCGGHFVKAQGHLDLHLGHEAHRMDVAALSLDS